MDNLLRIKEVIKEQGVTSLYLAEQLGITKQAMSLIVNGKRQPRYETLARIAEILNVDIRDLFISTKPETENFSDLFKAMRDHVDKVEAMIRDIEQYAENQ